MYQMLKTDCFVLRKQDFRDYDRLYILYSRDFGKMSFLARGAKRIKSKLAPALESFGEVRINFIKGRIFNHIAGTSLTKHSKQIFLSEKKISFSASILMLLDRLVKFEDMDYGIYSLLRETLFSIEEAEEGAFSMIDTYFFWRIIDLLGYRPQLDSCSICGKIYKGDEGHIFFNLTEHILICKTCAGSGVLLKDKTLRNLKEAFNLPIREFLKLKIDNELVAITDKAKEIKLSEL